MKKNGCIIFGGICILASDFEKWLHITLACAFLVKYLDRALVKFNDCVTTLIHTTLVIAEIILTLKRGVSGQVWSAMESKKPRKSHLGEPVFPCLLNLPSEVCRLHGYSSWEERET